MELLVPELQKEMEDVVGWFNENAQKLPDSKCLTWFKGNTGKTSHLGLIQEGKDLVNYALFKKTIENKLGGSCFQHHQVSTPERFHS
ncbi:hypothetical protein Bca101_008316 [Brassica carinata]